MFVIPFNIFFAICQYAREGMGGTKVELAVENQARESRFERRTFCQATLRGRPGLFLTETVIGRNYKSEMG